MSIIEGKLLTVKEVAEELGTTIRTAQREIVRGRFPRAFRVGREWRVPEDDVVEFVRRQWRERQAAASDQEGG